jgi:hypothetical protein
MAAARNRVSLRETGLIPIPQLPPPTNRLCESTHDGFAPDTQSRAATADRRSEQYATVTALAKQDGLAQLRQSHNHTRPNNLEP